MKTIIWTKLNTTSFKYELETDYRWLNERIKIMNEITIPSIRAQTDKNFLWVIEVREETFDHVKERLEVFEQMYLMKTKTKKLDDGSRATQKEEIVREYVDDDILYMVRLNSDDMYRKTFIEDLHSLDTAGAEAVIIPKGYFWYMKEKVVVKLEKPSPPFYVLVYDKQKYLEGFRYSIPGGHRKVKNLKHIKMPGRQWVWVIHDINNKILRIGKYPSYKKYKKSDILVLKEFR